MSDTAVVTQQEQASAEPQYVHFHYDGKWGHKREVLHGDKMKNTFSKIPIVDVSGMFSDKFEDRKNVAEEITKACEEVGFFYMKGHGVEQDLLDETFAVSKEYFSMPVENKMERWIYTNRDLRGYEPVHGANLDATKPRGDRKESFLWGYDPEYDVVKPTLTDEQKALLNTNCWPEDWPEFKQQMMKYHTRFLILARQLARCFALGLGCEETALDHLLTAPNTSQKILHYPPQDPTVKDDTGIGAHTDFCLFTILNQDTSGGLEVLNANAHWVPATPIQGTFVVNVGDFLMRLSNNRLVSTVHRVINETGAARYSIPFFISPNADAVLEYLPTCVFIERPIQYEPLALGPYHQHRYQLLRDQFKARQLAK
ncbi:hypothetical protein CLAIMM_11093 [Cladophialophora immunda]|nr:hypothetical protein CLAIMM_11093 [Cladophialophora immunda]